MKKTLIGLTLLAMMATTLGACGGGDTPSGGSSPGGGTTSPAGGSSPGGGTMSPGGSSSGGTTSPTASPSPRKS